MRTMKPGDFGFRDAEYAVTQSAKIKRLVHAWFRAQVRGKHHIPDRNFIAVGNHSGGTLMPDMLVWLSDYISAQTHTPLLALTNPLLFEYYPKRIARSLARMGAVRADPRVALQALAQGYALQIYPGGDRDACRSFVKRNTICFYDNQAYAKLALKTGTPILPVVSHGGHNGLLILNDGFRIARKFKLDRHFGLRAFPLSLCLPWGLWLGPLPGYFPLPCKITVEVLPPIAAEGSVHELDQRVRQALQDKLDQLASFG
jgi:1-acyl-sn-glycerol-3-phosphate acyltransferase